MKLYTLTVLTMIGFGAVRCGEKSVNIRSSWRSADAGSQTFKDCYGEKFTRVGSRFGKLVPAESLFLQDQTSKDISLCEILAKANADFVALQFVSAECEECEDEFSQIGDLINDQFNTGFLGTAIIDDAISLDWLQRIGSDLRFIDRGAKLEKYFTPPQTGGDSKRSIVVFNKFKEAHLYQFENLSSDDLTGIIQKLLQEVSPEDDSHDSPIEEEDLNFDPLEKGLNLLSKDAIRSELTHISSDQFGGRLSGTDGNVAVADFLIGHLTRLGIQPANGSDYRQTFRIANGPTSGKETSNIVGFIEGTDDVLKSEYIVIGAHMDHTGGLNLGYTCSNGSSGSNNICNGADDNGSGTITLLNIAKSLAAVRAKIKRSIVIMWFSGEEVGLEGSYHYVNSNPIFPISKTVFMINMDMVGYMESYGNKIAALGGGTSDIGAEILRSIDSKYDFSISISEEAGGGSDHVAFMRKGIPGAFFHTGVNNNPNYHRTSDTADRIDYDGMLNVAMVAFETALRVANEPSLVNFAFYDDVAPVRPPLVTEEEMQQTCHHLGLNPHAHEIFLEGRLE